MTLAVAEENPFVLFLLMLDEDVLLFSQIIDRFVKFLVDAASQTGFQ